MLAPHPVPSAQPEEEHRDRKSLSPPLGGADGKEASWLDGTAKSVNEPNSSGADC